jgi:hypothetical protein
MGVPSAAGFRLDMGESGAGRWVGNADKMLARGTLNLPSGVAGVAFQRLIAVGTIEFKFICAHTLQTHHAQSRAKKHAKNYAKIYSYF